MLTACMKIGEHLTITTKDGPIIIKILDAKGAHKDTRKIFVGIKCARAMDIKFDFKNKKKERL